jgi:hypothetical protein
MDEVLVVFAKSKKGPAELDAQLQGEVRAETLKTTRRLSAPFPCSVLYSPVLSCTVMSS